MELVDHMRITGKHKLGSDGKSLIVAASRDDHNKKEGLDARLIGVTYGARTYPPGGISLISYIRCVNTAPKMTT